MRLLRFLVHRSILFVTKDVWHITQVTGSPLRRFGINALKSLYMAVKGFIDLNLSNLASALAYSTVLSIIPLLAVIVGVAKGFGFQQTVYDFLLSYMPSQAEQLKQIFGFVDNYLSQVQGGLFLGVGLVFLFYTVFNLLSNIEAAFNTIWETPRNRPWTRKVVDYLALLLLFPIFITLSSGATLVMATIKNSFFQDYIFLTPIIENVFTLVPYVIIIFMFTALFMWLPSTRVRFVPALIAGTLAGVSFQIFQALYMTGLFWISKYNAIYGGFAAFPLLLLWIQLAWNITLFCMRLGFAIQNVHTFAYEKESSNVSRRYSDFLAIVIMAHIVQRFVNPKGLKPHTVVSLSDACRLPIAITSKVVEQLHLLGLIIEVNYDPKGKEAYYQPAVDTEQLTVGYLVAKLDAYGVEDFQIDMEQFRKPWQLLLATRRAYAEAPADTLLRNLLVE